MFFRQVLHRDLGCASYVIADGGEAVVVDPKWEIGEYLALADEHELRIAHVLETHNHADHVSGRGRLVAATGATVHVSKDAGVDYEHEPLGDGDEVRVGEARIVAVATPGHRPEHLAFLVYDGSRCADEPCALLSGDTLFVADVARPDLAVERSEGARGIYRSLRRLLELPDSVELWPGHIGGSLCGGAGMSEKPVSTLGFERRYNRLLKIEDEDRFVAELTSGLAPQPPNFERIVAMNRGPLVTRSAVLEPLAPARVQELLGGGATLLDARSTREYDAAHVPGSINVTMVNAAVGTRAAWVMDPEAPVVVAAAGETEARHVAAMLEAVGFRQLLGHLHGGVAAWQEAGLPVETTPALDVDGLAEKLRDGRVELLDVREDDEWESGHVAGSRHVPFHELRDVPDELRRRNGKPLAVACSAGNRSSIAVSLLRRAGVHDVEHVATGGVEDLEQHGFELVRDGA
jgi:glyoxylase-like metal-dependent hydrolase (beta-lactamase superfamily II)/rhodanese-related sulfurtransferase